MGVFDNLTGPAIREYLIKTGQIRPATTETKEIAKTSSKFFVSGDPTPESYSRYFPGATPRRTLPVDGWTRKEHKKEIEATRWGYDRAS